MTTRIEPDQLDQTANGVRTGARDVQAAIDEIERIVNSMSADFLGKRADDFRAEYARLRPTFANFTPFLEDFATMLERASADFREFEARNSGTTV